MALNYWDMIQDMMGEGSQSFRTQRTLFNQPVQWNQTANYRPVPAAGFPSL